MLQYLTFIYYNTLFLGLFYIFYYINSILLLLVNLFKSSI